jgi:hypothetical protein
MSCTCDTRYNGWTNYATWRVHLEMFDTYDTDGRAVTAEELEEMADEWVSDSGRGGIAESYARAFLADVDWREIADAVNEYNGVSDDADADDDDDTNRGGDA